MHIEESGCRGNGNDTLIWLLWLLGSRASVIHPSICRCCVGVVGSGCGIYTRGKLCSALALLC